MSTGSRLPARNADGVMLETDGVPSHLGYLWHSADLIQQFAGELFLYELSLQPV